MNVMRVVLFPALLSTVVACGGTSLEAKQPRGRSATAQKEEGACHASTDVLAEIDAIRKAAVPSEHLAIVMHRQHNVLEAAERRKRNGGGGADVERRLAPFEEVARERLDAAGEYAATVAKPRADLDRALLVYRTVCTILNREQKYEWMCEELEQEVGGLRRNDPSSLARFADELDRLPSSGNRLQQQMLLSSVGHARSLVRSLQAAAAAAAVLSAIDRTAPLDELSTLASSFASCPSSSRVHGASLVVAKERNPRALTVTVTAATPEDLSHQFQSIAKEATNADDAAFFHDFAEGGSFGSGFLVVLENERGVRTPLIVTNRHVVEFSTSVSIELEDGTTLPVRTKYIDTIYDLALLVPSDPQRRLAQAGGFALSSRPPRDGDDVIATGYPALGERPSFQTTRGYVSNERLRLQQAEPLLHVQHTAPIDPGSSGGPLLGRDGAVIGVNAFKPRDRDSVGVAVPVSAVTRLLEDGSTRASCDGPCRAVEAERACLALASELSEHEPSVFRVQRMLGARLVSTLGIDSYDMMADDDPGIRARFERAPFATLSEAVARRLVSNVKLHPLEACGGVRRQVESILQAPSFFATMTATNGHIVGFAFRWNESAWKIDEVTGLP